MTYRDFGSDVCRFVWCQNAAIGRMYAHYEDGSGGPEPYCGDHLEGAVEDTLAYLGELGQPQRVVVYCFEGPWSEIRTTA